MRLFIEGFCSKNLIDCSVIDEAWSIMFSISVMSLLESCYAFGGRVGKCTINIYDTSIKMRLRNLHNECVARVGQLHFIYYHTDNK